MSYYGPTITPQVLPESQAFGEPLHLSRFEGLELSAQHEFESIANAAQNYYLKKKIETERPGQMLSEDEWKKSPYYRPGMEVKGPIGENVAKFEADYWDNNRIYQAQLNAMPDGFLSAASRFVGGNIGALLNPIMAVTGTALGAIAGKGANVLLQDIASRTVSAAAKGAIKGAAVNLGFVAPATLADYMVQDELNQNPSGLAAMASLGLSVGLGGLIGGVAAPLSQTARFEAIQEKVAKETNTSIEALKSKIDQTREVVTRRSFLQAKDTAIAQFENDKDINVEPILQNGYREARLQDADRGLMGDDVSRETLRQVRETIESDFKESNQRIANQKELLKQIEDVIAEPKLREKMDIATLEFLNRKIADKERVMKEGGLSKDEQKLKELLNENEDLRNQMNHLQALEAMIDDPGEPVKGDEVKAAGEKVNSYRGDNIYDAQNMIESKPIEPETHEGNVSDMQRIAEQHEETLNDMIQQGKLKQEAINEFERVQATTADLESIKRLIKQAGDCLKGIG